jgi:hypothetical protein
MRAPWRASGDAQANRPIAKGPGENLATRWTNGTGLMVPGVFSRARSSLPDLSSPSASNRGQSVRDGCGGLGICLPLGARPRPGVVRRTVEHTDGCCSQPNIVRVLNWIDHGHTDSTRDHRPVLRPGQRDQVGDQGLRSGPDVNRPLKGHRRRISGALRLVSVLSLQRALVPRRSSQATMWMTYGWSPGVVRHAPRRTARSAGLDRAPHP